MIDDHYIDEDGNYIDDEIIDEYADIEFDDEDECETAPPKPKSKYEDFVVSFCIILALLLILTAFFLFSFKNIIFD